jgi:hypothetical protein
MKLIEALCAGTLGVEVDLPPERTESNSAADDYVCFDPAGVRWQYHFQPVALDLSPRFDALLGADVEANARALPRQMDRQSVAQTDEAPGEGPLVWWPSRSLREAGRARGTTIRPKSRGLRLP